MVYPWDISHLLECVLSSITSRNIDGASDPALTIDHMSSHLVFGAGVEK